MNEMSEIGIKLESLPELGFPKFRMSLMNINYALLILNALLKKMINSNVANSIILDGEKQLVSIDVKILPSF